MQPDLPLALKYPLVAIRNRIILRIFSTKIFSKQKLFGSKGLNCKSL